MSSIVELPHEIPLEGVSNLRDLGGWPTRDGGRVRRGQVFRSAALHALTPGDTAALGELGVRHIVDFRGDAERARWPTRPAEAVTIHALTITPITGTAMRELMNDPASTAEDVARVMRLAYGSYINDWHHRYRAMFDLLVNDVPAPLLFHCTAGKDRTGVAAMLILAALGVEEEVIRHDYLATNRLWRRDAAVVAGLPPQVADTLLSVQNSFLDAAFEAIQTGHGGTDAYLRDRIGLDDARRGALRARLVE
ncbi:MAG: tyrosine-protein phosphatase [Acetobacteraceae bacterium]|nr:tyrosine-protein phosphatase [Acetobacteraceae bacterium]